METVTDILIDISGSMKNIMGLTKQLLINDVLPLLDYSSRIGIKTFSTVGNPRKPLINPILQLNKTDKEVIEEKIKGIVCSTGWSPIAYAIRSSVASLSEYMHNDKTIILVTDGAETEGGDYVSEAQKAASKGFECKIHVIGLHLTEESKLKAKEIAEKTGGTASFVSFRDMQYRQKDVGAFLLKFRRFQLSQSNPARNQNFTSPVLSLKHKDEKTQRKNSTVSEPETNAAMDTATEVHPEAATNLFQEEGEMVKKELGVVYEEDPILNERIRSISEQCVYDILNIKYPNRVKWLNQNGESHEDHDFEVLELDGKTIEYYIECKGASRSRPTFYLTKNEWRLFLNHTKNYQIYFVRNTLGDPDPIYIENLLDWLLKGKIVPYLNEREIIKEDRVFLTVNNILFTN